MCIIVFHMCRSSERKSVVMKLFEVAYLSTAYLKKIIKSRQSLFRYCNKYQIFKSLFKTTCVQAALEPEVWYDEIIGW